MLTFLALVFTSLHAEPRLTDQTFIKGTAPAIRLRMTADGRAQITREGRRLVEGSLVGGDSTFRIETAEGEICPPVEIELVHDVEGGPVGAELTIDLSGVDGQARRACAELTVINGTYAQIAP